MAAIYCPPPTDVKAVKEFLKKYQISQKSISKYGSVLSKMDIPDGGYLPEPRLCVFKAAMKG